MITPSTPSCPLALFDEIQVVRLLEFCNSTSACSYSFDGAAARRIVARRAAARRDLIQRFPVGAGTRVPASLIKRRLRSMLPANAAAILTLDTSRESGSVVRDRQCPGDQTNSSLH